MVGSPGQYAEPNYLSLHSVCPHFLSNQYGEVKTASEILELNVPKRLDLASLVDDVFD